MGNIVKLEVWLVEHGTCKYAQYEKAPFVKFIKKGARTLLKIQQSYSPFLVIAEGWNLPLTPEDLYSVSLPSSDGVKITTSKYSSFDERFVTDFEAQMAKSKINVLAVYK
jgi:hypothetical protein